MLQPLKPINSTASTEATEPTDAVRPIAEQRPGNTLQDRLYRKPEITGGGKMPAEKGNDSSLFQQYSLAKYMPTTPIAPASKTANFQETFGKFENYNDFWSNLIGSAKTPAEKQVVHYKGGVGTWYSEREGAIRDQYTWTGDQMDKFVKGELAAQDLQKNKYFQALTKKYSEYHKQDPIYSVLNSGSGQDPVLGTDELEAIYDMAQREGLGQRGYEALLDQTFTAKSMYHAKSGVEGLVKGMETPDSADWGSISKSLGVSSEMTGGELFGGDLNDNLTGSGAGTAGAGVAANFLVKWANLFGASGMATAGAGTFMPVAAALHVAGVLQDLGSRTLEKARFSPIKNGRLATSIDDFGGTEKQNLKDWAEEVKISPNEMVKAMNTLFMQKMAKSAILKAKDYDTMTGFTANDNRIGYGKDTLTQTQQYVKGQGDLGYYSPEYWGSYKEMFKPGRK